MKTKRKLDAKRIELFRQKGIDSPEYIKQLVSDTKEIMGLQKEVIEEVTQGDDTLNDIIEKARDTYIGEMKVDVTTASIQKLLGIFVD